MISIFLSSSFYSVSLEQSTLIRRNWKDRKEKYHKKTEPCPLHISKIIIFIPSFPYSFNKFYIYMYIYNIRYFDSRKFFQQWAKIKLTSSSLEEEWLSLHELQNIISITESWIKAMLAIWTLMLRKQYD